MRSRKVSFSEEDQPEVNLKPDAMTTTTTTTTTTNNSTPLDRVRTRGSCDSLSSSGTDADVALSMCHDDEDDDEDEDEEMRHGTGVPSRPPTPPDGGWGWVVVLASFMIHIVTDGVTYTFGNFFPEFLREFKNSRSNTSWIISILAGVTLGSGPLVSALSNKYNCQRVCMVGAIFASACLFVSSYATSISTLYVSIGLGTGLGLGLVYLPAIVMVTTYFDKRRAFATGIAVCGSGMGTLLFAPLTEHLIGTYGWRWALAIVAGIVLCCILFAAVFRPLRHKSPKQSGTKSEKLPAVGEVTSEEQQFLQPNLPTITIQNVEQDAEPKDSAYQSSVSSSETAPDSVEHVVHPVQVSAESEGEAEAAQNQNLKMQPAWQKNPRLQHLDLGSPRSSELARSLPTLEEGEVAEGASLEIALVSNQNQIQNTTHFNASGRRRASSEAHNPRYTCQLETDSSGKDHLRRPSPSAFHHASGRSSSSLATQKNMGFALAASSMLALQVRQNSLAHLAEQVHHSYHRHSSFSHHHRRGSTRPNSAAHHGTSKDSRGTRSAEPVTRRPPSPVPFVDEPKQFCQLPRRKLASKLMGLVPNDLLLVLYEMLNFSILKDHVFLLFASANFVTSVGYILPYCFLMDRASLELGIDPHSASKILGMIGMASMGGRLVFGFLADHVCFNRLWLYSGCIVCCGVATFFCPLATEEYSLTLYAIVFGATSGAYVGLSSVILVDLMASESTGVDDALVNAFGILLLFQGAATTVGPPIGGWVTDIAENSDATFRMAGALIGISGLVLSFTPCLVARREQKRCKNAARLTQSPE